jgi:hypothetical protein
VPSSNTGEKMKMEYQIKPMIQYNGNLVQYSDWVWYRYRITSVNKVCFPIKKGLKDGNVLLSLLFNFVLKYAI